MYLRDYVNTQPISLTDAAMVMDRDFNGFYYPAYSTDRTAYPQGTQQTGLFVGGNLVGFAFAGITKEGAGEISIMHIAPEVENIGLGSLLNAMTKKWLVETGAQSLRSVVMDKTGKIAHLLEKQGFIETGRKMGRTF